MVPTWVLFISIILSMWAGAGLMAFLRTPRKTAEVDRTDKKETRPLNVFDAYSDKDLQKQREETARTIQAYRKMRYTAEPQIRYLREIDDEIQARANAKLALEEDKRTAHERDIAIFDSVYGEVLKHTNKEINNA